MARLYVVLVLPMLVALNLVLPAFHAPDDYDHAKRAYSAAHGTLWPGNQPGLATGGMIDNGLDSFIEQQKPTIFLHRQANLARPDIAVQDRATPRWTGTETYAEFASAGYFPLIYLPQMAALRLAEALDLSVPDSILLARLANGAAAVALAASAVAVLPFGASAVLLVLLLPKTLVQFASNSPDPIFHACTIALLALAGRAMIQGFSPRTRHYVLAALALLAAAGARPSMALLSLPLLWPAWRDRNRTGLALLIAAPLAAAAWFLANLQLSVDPRCDLGGSFMDRAVYFATHGPDLLAATFARHGLYYLTSFIGELGWGHALSGSVNHVMSPWVYVGAIVLTVFALAVAMGTPCPMPRAWRVMLLATGLAMAAAIFFLLHVGCTKLGASVISGVQGRYLVTPFLLVTAALCGIVSPMERLARLFPAAMVLFALGGFGALVVDGLHLYWRG